MQLKTIAKRYKNQYDETLAQKEELTKKLSEEQPAEDTSKQDNMIKTLNDEKKSLQDEMEKLNQSLTTSKVGILINIKFSIVPILFLSYINITGKNFHL